MEVTRRNEQGNRGYPLVSEDKITDILKVEGINARGFGTIPKLVMQDMRLTAEAKCVYAYFCSYAGSGNQAFPSVSLILQHLGLSEGRYYRHFILLKKFGYIKTTQLKTDGKYSKTIYTLMVNPVSLPQEQTGISQAIVPNSPYPHFESTQIECTQNEGTNINSILKLTDLNNSINQSIPEEEKPDGLSPIGLIDGGSIDQDAMPLEPGAEAKGTSPEEERSVYRKLIADNIFLAGLKAEYGDDDLIDNLYELIVETVTSKKPVIRVGGEDKPAVVVHSTLLKLNDNHIRYVVDALRANTSKAVNIKAYTLTALYNAHLTMGAYYTNRVQHDLYGDRAVPQEPPSATSAKGRRAGRWMVHNT